jgi:amino acid adenylation domain-containing protein
MRLSSEPRCLSSLLMRRAGEWPAGIGYVLADGGGEDQQLSYGALDDAARRVAAQLQDAGVLPGERALLLYPPGRDYLAGLFGCLYAGVIAVPLYPPSGRRGAERVLGVARDAAASVAMTDEAGRAAAAQSGRLAEVHPARWLVATAAGAADGPAAGDFTPVHPAADSFALLQYTSGSTAMPKGVLLTHANLLHNSAVIAGVLAPDEESRGVSWLPPYHDMGLIGGILQPLYSGFPCLLMSPLSFIYEPARWLRAISEFRATDSAAPDFAYAECVHRVSDEEVAGLDLSCWRNALVGAEPVRAQTLRAFAARFGQAGFRLRALRPCYGLAEATLFVTGATGAAPATVLTLDRAALSRGSAAPARHGATLVGCGLPQGTDLVRIVDPQTRHEQAPGTVGEIWVSGPTVGAGYWGDPALTRSTFRARLAGDPKRRWLRTGDLGFRHGADIVVTGRLKDLIIVRGANHYPADIEATAIQASEALAAGRSAAFSVDDGQAERVVLVCELARGGGQGRLDEVVGSVRAAVATEHRLDLDDVVLVKRGAVPRTSSGKVRRAACREAYLAGLLPVLSAPARPAPAGAETGGAETGGAETAGAETAGAEAAAAAPAAARPATSRPEQAGPDAIAALVAEVLGRPPAGLRASEPLAGQGLDSLRAARLQRALWQCHGIEAALDWLLADATIAGLAEKVRGAGPAAGTEPVLPATRAGTVAVASSGQQRLWLLDQLGAGAAYNIAGLLRWESVPDVEALRAALQLLTVRHEALRTGFRLAADGGLEQFAVSAPPVALPAAEVRDEAGLASWCRRFGGQRFDLGAPPLWRAALLRVTGSAEWVLAVCIHHIVTDGWSLGVLATELEAAYSVLAAGGTPRLSELPHRYADFAVWQRDALSAGAFAGQAEYWRRALAGAEPLELPVGSPPGGPSFTGGRIPVELPADLTARLRELAEAEQATPFMVLAAAWSVLLSRWSGRTDVVWAVPVAGRRHAELDGVVGFFVNTLPVRVRLGGEPSFRELISTVKRACLAAYAHQDLPFDEIVRQARAGRDSSGRTPLVRHFLALNDTPGQLTGLRLARAEESRVDTGAAKFDFGVELSPRLGGDLSGFAEYDTGVLSPAAAHRLAAGLVTVVRAGCTDPGRPASRLPVMPVGEQARVTRTLAAGRGPQHQPSAGVPRQSLAQRLESVVDRWPDRPALTVDGTGQTVSYAEMDGLCNRLGRLLRARGAGPETAVGVCLERGADLISTVLAVWKAGAVYVPLDPGYPPARLQDMVTQARPVVVVTVSALRHRLPDSVTAVCLDRGEVADEVAAWEPGPLGVRIRPENAAYAVFTSGSTGQPKGAVNTHRGLLNRMSALQRRLGMEPSDVVGGKTPIGFDVCISELLWPLLCGARLVLAEPGGHRDPRYLHELFARHRVTTADFVPSMLGAFLAAAGPADHHPYLRRVICIGEELSAVLASDFLCRYPGAELHNRYGPAEAAIDVTEYQAGPAIPVRVPIGVPIEGTRLYVLDRWLQPLPVGVAGELFIGGKQVGRGYVNRPGLTAERFLPSPFRAGARVYATGDRARWTDEGVLEFLGRVDFQVKVRGHRVEPGEIEARLRACQRVADAVVAARPGEQAQQRLIAYLVAAGEPPDDHALRAALSEHLPDAMIPYQFVWLSALPLSNNGKIDRRALPDAPQPGRPSGAPFVPPRDGTERRIAAIWAELLDGRQVGMHDSFFDLGGHSLLATRVISRIRAELGVELPLTAVLTGRPTIEKLAEQVRDRQLGHATPADLRAVLAAVAELSDEEVTARLAAGPGVTT